MAGWDLDHLVQWGVYCVKLHSLQNWPPLIEWRTKNLNPFMEHSKRNFSLSPPWFLMAVDCVSHCVSTEAPSLTTMVISPFCTLGKLQWTSPYFPISLPSVDWWATFVFFLHLICIFIIIIIIISTCCLRELTNEQYAHVKKKIYQKAPSHFMNSWWFVLFVLLLQNCHVNWCCFMFKHTHTNIHRHTLVMTTLLFLMTKVYFNYI